MDTAKQKPKKESENIPTLLKIVRKFEKDEELKDLIAFNETYQNIQFLKDWNKCKKNSYLEDEHESFLLYSLTEKLRQKISKSELGDAMTEIAHRKIIRPIRDWLDSLIWDGTPRLGSWLHAYAGAEINDYTAQAGKITLTAAVARIYEPGVKFDYLLILEGPQRKGKSTLVKAIGGDWYLDMSLKENDKDIIDELRGCWVVEMSELAGFNRKEVDWLKSFLSRQVDRCRLSYGRRSKDFKRQVVFIGTMNPSGDNTYFRDDTGNMRFWPVTCGMIKVPEFKAVRNQLFAEAKNFYFTLKKQKDDGIIDGDYPFFLQGKASEISEKEQSKRELIDPWEMEVSRILTGKEETNTFDILRGLGLSIAQIGHGEKVRIGKILSKFGWHRHQRSDGHYIYIKEEVKSQGRYASKQEEVVWSEEIIKT